MEYPVPYQILHYEAFFDGGALGSLPRRLICAVAYPPFAAAVLATLYLIVSPVWGTGVKPRPFELRFSPALQRGHQRSVLDVQL